MSQKKGKIKSAQNLLGELLAVVLGSSNHGLELANALILLAGLKTTVGVDPELVGAEELEHLLNAVLHLLLVGDTGRLDEMLV